MNKELIIWGASGHAKVIIDIINSLDSSIVAFVDRDVNISSPLRGVPLFRELDGLNKWVLSSGKSDESLEYIIAIGGDKGRDRLRIAEQLPNKSFPIIRHKSACISKSVLLGAGCHVFANTVVAADTTVGSFTIINNSANVDHECQIGNGVHIGPGATLCGCIEIGDGSFVGAGAVILPRIKIGADVIVGAGAVVTEDVEDGAVVIGVPARPLT